MEYFYGFLFFLNKKFNFLFSLGDNGTMYFWDWKTGYNFQRLQASAQPGSIDSEAGIFAMTFDKSGTRLLTAEADKTIKIYKEDETAVSCSVYLNCVKLHTCTVFKYIIIYASETHIICE